MECELCGKKAKLVRAEIEGVVLEVCPDCARLGTIVELPKSKSKILKNFTNKPELEIVSEYNLKISERRKKLNLSLKELAQKINEKESVLKRIEHKELIPDDKIARKLEKFLGISLYEKVISGFQTTIKKGGKDLTIGDIAKIRVKENTV